MRDIEIKIKRQDRPGQPARWETFRVKYRPNLNVIAVLQELQVNPELKDGKKTLADIYEYIKPQVEDEAKAMNVQQTPSLLPDTGIVKGKFVVRK